MKSAASTDTADASKMPERVKGPFKISGSLYRGRAAFGATGKKTVIVIAADDDTLDWVWSQLFYTLELNKDLVRDVIMGDALKAEKVEE